MLVHSHGCCIAMGVVHEEDKQATLSHDLTNYVFCNSHSTLRIACTLALRPGALETGISVVHSPLSRCVA